MQSKRKKKKIRRTLSRKKEAITSTFRLNQSEDGRASDALTVAWMLATMAALVFGIFELVARGVQFSGNNAANSSTLGLDAMIQVTSLAAVVSAVMSLVLLVVVLRVRREAPPRTIVIGSIFIAAVPLLAPFLRT